MYGNPDSTVLHGRMLHCLEPYCFVRRFSCSRYNDVLFVLVSSMAASVFSTFNSVEFEVLYIFPYMVDNSRSSYLFLWHSVPLM